MKVKDITSKYYKTHYTVKDGSVFTNYVKADNILEAKKILNKRNLKESLDDDKPSFKRPTKLTSQLLKEGNYIKALHGLVFFLYESSLHKTSDPLHELSDQGLLHNYIHFLSIDEKYHVGDYTKEQLLKEIETLESKSFGK